MQQHKEALLEEQRGPLTAPVQEKMPAIETIVPPAVTSTQVTLPPKPPMGFLTDLTKTRVEVPQSKKHVNSHQHFPQLVGPYRIARLVQYVNSRLHYGWIGSRAEKRHCEAWNLKPVPVQQ